MKSVAPTSLFEDLPADPVLAEAPESLEPLKGLRLLYEQSGDYACLTEILERLAKQVPPSESAGLLLKAADFYEQKLQRKDRAVLCCQRASRIDSKDRRTFR